MGLIPVTQQPLIFAATLATCAVISSLFLHKCRKELEKKNADLIKENIVLKERVKKSQGCQPSVLESSDKTGIDSTKSKDGIPNQYISSCQESKFIAHPIGVVRSVFTNKNYCPNQPSRVPSSRGRLDLAKLTGSLEGLEDFSHIWVLFRFNKTSRNGKLCRGKVLPPRKKDNVKVGVYSCRTPTRPNPIGLSLLKIEWIDKAKFQIHVSSLDLLDGTPILDIKPFIPCHDLPNGKVRLSNFVEQSSNLEPDFADAQVADNIGQKLSSIKNWGIERNLLGENEEEQIQKLVQIVKELILWDGRKKDIQKTHADTDANNDWIFEVGSLDFIINFPAQEVVRCVDVMPKGRVRYVRGSGIVGCYDQ